MLNPFKSAGVVNNKTNKEDAKILKSWYQERYESTLIQRNVLFLLLTVAIGVLAASVFIIGYIRSTRSIEPFVIEIEKKTGVATVVDPLTVAAYSANEAVKRYFVMKYISSREEYFQSTFSQNYYTVVRVLSTPNVYFSDYKPKFSLANPNSPYNIYGQASTRKISLKSIIFPTEKSAQVRIMMEVSGAVTSRSDKIVFLEFDFQNVEMNEQERLINPLGFRVTLYRIEDERIQ